ncbi:glucose-methanol-choline oxidoreductase [Penicillium sp. IBT 35674x]|nr:glucose-methanol-choline oxidoreductase [Penicillium sp. IBT 35674x]
MSPRNSLPLDGSTFDYIICGGGTAGCVLAAELSTIPGASVLLVEAGRDSELEPDVLVPGKYVKQLQEDKEGLWELATVSQRELNDRKLVFLRGRQLGGSSAVNYMALARGPKDDYDQWSQMTGDEGWKWENILPMMKDLEDFDFTLPQGMDKFARPLPSNHEMVPGVETYMQACSEVGIPLCLDNNAGNPVGVGLAQFNVRDGERSYAANAFLPASTRKSLKNLVIVTNTECDYVHSTNGVATRVDLYDRSMGKTVAVHCRKEVILAAGTFGSPKILMLSGIGQRKTLEHHGIPVKIDLPGVGQNMLDHSIITCEYKVDNRLPAHNKMFLDPKALEEAEAEYAKSRTGPLAMYGSSGSVAFPRIQRLFESKEFSDLDSPTKAFLLEPSRPSAEIWLGSGPSVYEGNSRPEDSYITHELLLQNNLSKGVVSIRSRNPREHPIIDPKFLSHPFDRRIAIETVRKALQIARSKAYQGVIERMVHGPNIDFATVDLNTVSDDVMLDFIRKNLDQGYHSMSTCRMGKANDPTAVVDSNFRVRGMHNLRVADLSVCPVLTCNHTQINAYLIGLRCARQIIDQHAESIQRAKL